MSELPKGWSWTTLGEHTAPNRRGVNPKDHPTETFDLLSIPAYDNGHPEIINGAQIGSTKNTVEPGDVMISKIVPHIRRVWVVPQDNGRRQISSSEWITFRSPVFLPSFLRHYLLSDVFHRQFMNTVAGVGGSLLRARPKDVARIQVPLPPLEEQRRIATILDRAKDIENLSKARDVHYSQLEENLHISTVGTPEAPIGDAYTVPFGELIKVSSGKFLPSHAMDPGGTHLVYGGNGANGFHNEYMFDSPTVVIGRVGAYCGAVHLTEPKSWVSDNALYVKSTSKEMDAIFLSASLRRAHLNQFANKSGQPSISAGKISHAPILVAPMELQKQFAQKIAATRALHSKTALSHQHMVQLTSSLQSRAFRGEL